ncbi:hypothetical protein CWC33_04245 [Idiomarina sp. X4]|uniref:hypothetical protein n=1 Tax=Idiomarina sp. X4 TaxID=2055892 RepID=UPI000C282425|nr:hypothetical protein [Idiomarina sp. X4]ATZ72949.1 hypothetical protein CWC33_04245 [Idiomarina sp. X4]
MKTLLLSTIFLISALLSFDAFPGNDKEGLTAVEVSFDINIKGDEFSDLKAIPVLGHPMTLYMTHPNSMEDYKIEILVSELTHQGKQIPKLYLKAYKKEKDSWDNIDSIETMQGYNSSSSFSIGSDSDDVLSGKTTISTYDKEIKANSIEECSSTNMLSAQSCCSIPCQDGSPNKLKCCGGVGCCGCGICCQIP